MQMKVKFVLLAAVCPLYVTDMGPVDAPAGTEVVMLVGVLAVTCAVTPLNLTVFSAAIALKVVPVMVTTVPGVPLVGEKFVMTGVNISCETSRASEFDVHPATVTLTMYAPGFIAVCVLPVAPGISR